MEIYYSEAALEEMAKIDRLAHERVLELAALVAESELNEHPGELDVTDQHVRFAGECLEAVLSQVTSAWKGHCEALQGKTISREELLNLIATKQ